MDNRPGPAGHPDRLPAALEFRSGHPAVAGERLRGHHPPAGRLRGRDGSSDVSEANAAAATTNATHATSPKLKKSNDLHEKTDSADRARTSGPADGPTARLGQLRPLCRSQCATHDPARGGVHGQLDHRRDGTTPIPNSSRRTISPAAESAGRSPPRCSAASGPT